MSLPLVYALLAWQQPAPPPTAPSVPQPIARVDVKPADYALQVGDTVRLHAVAYDSSGRVMPEAVIRWFASGGRRFLIFARLRDTGRLRFPSPGASRHPLPGERDRFWRDPSTRFRKSFDFCERRDPVASFFRCGRNRN